MTKHFAFLGLLFLNICCNQNSDKKQHAGKIEKNGVARFYSKFVADTFSIFVNLPNDYNSEQKTKYPVNYYCYYRLAMKKKSKHLMRLIHKRVMDDDIPGEISRHYSDAG